MVLRTRRQDGNLWRDGTGGYAVAGHCDNSVVVQTRCKGRGVVATLLAYPEPGPIRGVGRAPYERHH